MNKKVWRTVVAVLAVGLMAAFAFAFTFTTFGPWDDEGYFLQSYRGFLSGQAPYDQLFSFYGPFGFLSSALVARFDPVNVTHDTFRWFLLPAWILIALLIAGVAWRWTGRYSAALISFFLVGIRLLGLTVSIGHPQLWIILAVAVLLWLGLDSICRHGKRSNALWTGVVLGIILLCKINIAIFICVAMALTASLQLKGRIRVISSGVLVAAARLGLLLLFSASVGSEKYFALAYFGVARSDLWNCEFPARRATAISVKLSGW